jgi:short-subunit dehydrogenase
MKNILIIGATSAITMACARRWASEGCKFFLVARNREKLEQLSSDLSARGASAVMTYVADLADISQHADMLDSGVGFFGQIDIALIGHGTLSDQKACEKSVELTLQEVVNNGTSVILLLTLLSNIMEKQRCGVLAVISSVAGDRGRKSNYVYGSAKGFVGVFVQGLQHRLARTGVQVTLIKPGPTDTPMTSHLKADGARLATVDEVSKSINDGIRRGKHTIYAPGRWLLIMLIIKSIPSFIFNKLDI